MTEFNLACTAADFSVGPWATGHMANVPGVPNHTLVNGRDLPESIVVKTFLLNMTRTKEPNTQALKLRKHYLTLSVLIAKYSLG